MIAYKVVERVEGKLISAVAQTKVMGLEYRVGKKTYAKRTLSRRGYHPLVFKNEAAAMSFASDAESVFVCRTGEEKPLPQMKDVEIFYGTWSDRSIKTIREFDISPVRIGSQWPPGTAMVEWVELIVEVTP